MFKTIKFGLELIKAQIFNRNVPLCVGIHITSRCNFKCIYCYGAYSEKQADVFTKADIFNLINELKRMGTCWITLTGGEPLLREDIGEIIEKIKKENIVCSINTNGSLIKKKLDIVKKIDFVTVSLDGIETFNDLNRGSGTYKLIMEGIKQLKGNNIPFDVVCVLTHHNMDCIDGMLDLAEEFGFLVEFNFLQDQNIELQDHSKFYVADEIMKNITRKIISYKREGRPVYYTVGSRRYSLTWPCSYKEKILFKDFDGFKPIHCYMGERMCHIDYDGKVYPCIQLAGKFPALNFLDVGFKKAWENLQKNKTCKSCYAVCYAEYNRLFSLSLDVLFNNAVNLFKK